MNRRSLFLGVAGALAASKVAADVTRDGPTSYFRIMPSDLPTPEELSRYVAVRLSRWAVDDDGNVYEDDGPL